MNLTWWQILLGAIAGLLILTVLVVLHELGHAFVAKRNGVEVEEFGVGFPPRAKAFGKVKGTLVTLNWLPLGGFCNMKGESDDATGKGTYGAASLWAKTKILLAGVTMNFLTACVLLTILAFIGIPKIDADQFAIASDNNGEKGIVSVYSVVEGSPADEAGLQEGDEIVSIAGNEVELSSEVPELTERYAGSTVDIVVRRSDGDASCCDNTSPDAADCSGCVDSLSLTAKINNENTDGKGRLGITTEQKQSGTIKATWSAPLVGITNACQFFWLTLKGLWSILCNLCQGVFDLIIGSEAAKTELATASSGVSGPVGILGQIFPAAVFAGPSMVLYISAVVSVSLAVMNLLPIPGLDGGRLYLTLWYRCRGKKLTKEKEEQIVGNGMMFIFALVILITIVDILKYF